MHTPLPSLSIEICLGIEKVWSAAKTYFKKRLLASKNEIDDAQFRKMVIESFTQLPEQKLKNLLRSNHAYIIKMLNEGI